MRTRVLLLLALGGLLAAAAAAGDGRIQVSSRELRWKDAPATLPFGTLAAVLEGDPKAEGIFTMRLRVPAHVRIEPHWHPQPERVTVLSGSVLVGFGDRFDETAGKRFSAGSFYVNPPKVNHFVWTDEEATLQLTGLGPWEVRFLQK